MSATGPVTGGCACEAIRYEYSSETLLGLNCHCRDCQRASGSAYGSLLIVDAASFRMLGAEPKYYTKVSDAGNPISRGFCAECGSPVTIIEPERPKIVFIHAASLDQPGVHRPGMDIFTASAHPWDAMNPDLDKFPGMPPIPDSFGR